MDRDRQKKRLRVLCLHGYRQNSQIFRQKTGALRKALKSRVDFEFVSAPLVPNLYGHVAKGAIGNDDDCDSQSAVEEQPRAWWISNREANTFSSKDVTETAAGFDESLDCVLNFMRDQGSFDGLLGFSQGASFIQLLLSSSTSRLDDQIRGQLRFVILFSGFKSLSTVHRPLMDARLLAVPSFHVCGLSDEIVLPSRSEELAEMFENSQIAKHPGKHCIPPMKEPILGPLLAFIDKLIN